jgi:hypothetical protein
MEYKWIAILGIWIGVGMVSFGTKSAEGTVIVGFCATFATIAVASS